MKTDYAIYQYLSTGAEAFRVLTGGLPLAGPYRFESLTFKRVKRRIDGLFEPQGHDGPAYVVEFQAQRAPHAWYNLLTKVGLYGERHPRREARGVLIFLCRRYDPKVPAWTAKAAPGLTAVYLDDILPALLEHEPDNPFVAVFGPLVLDSDEALMRQAPRLLRTIQTADVPEPVRASLAQILEFWLLERFPTLTEQEIWNMLDTLVPLEETRAYKSIFAKGVEQGKVDGRAEGKAEGKTEGEALLLKRQIARRFRTLPAWARERIDAAEAAQLEAWAEAIFDAADIEQLLGPRHTA